MQASIRDLKEALVLVLEANRTIAHRTHIRRTIEEPISVAVGMKRKELLRHLRHTEIHEFLAKKICRDLGMPEPWLTSYLVVPLL